MPESLCSDYRADIENHLQAVPARDSPQPAYQSTRARAVAVDWLVSFSDRFDLRPRTLALAVHLLDSCGGMVVSPLSLTYVTVTALHIACKYEQIYPPALAALIDRAWRSLLPQEIYHYQKAILEVLDYRLTTPMAVDLGETSPELLFLLECSYFSSGWPPAEQLRQCRLLQSRKGGKQVLRNLMFIKAEGLDSLIRKHGKVKAAKVQDWQF